ncbi:hypothetical protein [Streptomyces sp. NPDC091416]
MQAPEVLDRSRDPLTPDGTLAHNGAAPPTPSTLPHPRTALRNAAP